MIQNNRILHPTNSGPYSTDSEFYYKKCYAGLLYDEWMKIFLENGLIYENEPSIIRFEDYGIYTPFTYKFNFNFPLDSSNHIFPMSNYKHSDYELFANLFFTKGWENELKYELTQYPDRNFQKPNPKYSDYYGDILVHIKPWIDYLTFQGSRTIIQFRLDKYITTELRKEKLKKLCQYQEN